MTIKFLLFVATLCFLPFAALASEADLYCQTGTSSTGVPIFQPASNANPCPATGSGGSSAPYNYTDLGYVQMTSLGSAVSLSSIPTGAKYAFITVEGAPIRFRGDSTNPTATVGIPVGTGQQIILSISLNNVRVIQQSAGAILNIEYAQ